MTSFRGRRVVIASLFLPNSAVLGESPPPTPERHLANASDESSLSIPAVTQRLAERPRRMPLPPVPSITSSSSLPVPLKSIVEDLKDKSRNPTPAVRSPTQEIANPFAKLPQFTLDTTQKDSTRLTAHSYVTTTAPASPPSYLASPPPMRKHQTTHTDHAPRAGGRRKHSRSASRRADPDSPRATGGFNEPWHIESNPHCNGGLKNAVDSVGAKLKKKLWVGTLGTNTDSFSDTLRRNIDRRMLLQSSSLPVWIPDDEFQGCYAEFCHQVLWPCLHYAIPDAPKTKLFYESASFSQYVAVNQRFADAIIASHQEGDIIWVNDYHLMLLPALLRASPKIPPSTPIGFFMHVAFPSSEIFRCLSVRQDLLRGLLGADLVGFQTANYARHFRQTVSRIMSYEALPKGIQVADGDGLGPAEGEGKEKGETRGRFVDVGVFPMGIDVWKLKEKKAEPEVKDWVQVLTQRYNGMKIVVGRDKLDEIQGVRQKIQAFEYFLDKYPEFQGRVVLIQVALQTTESNELAGGVADVVSRLNSRFSTLTYQPVVFLHTQDLTFPQYLALLSVADAFIVTSLREGMALRTHEYVECQEGKYRPLVLSEFTGSYSYSGFRSCIAVNPWDTRGTAAAINQALTMTPEEAHTRWVELHNHVTTQTAQAFVTSFLNRCIRAHTEHHIEDDAGEDVPVLDMGRVVVRYRHSTGRRLIVADLEGTLWKRDMRIWLDEEARKTQKAQKGVDAEVPEEVIEVLGKLAEDRRNEVWLLSGFRVKGALERIAERVPSVGLVAENGCFIKTRKTRSENGEWINMVANFNLTWKSACLEILNYFTERTPGSFVEAREASMVWRFWTGEPSDVDSADRQWARRQAAEAQNHIFDSLGERYGLRIIPGKNSFLVLPNNISRATSLAAILHPGGPARSPLSGRAAWMSPDASSDVIGGDDLDFILAVSGDEKLLRRLNEFDNSETCSTGGKGTDAKWRIEPGKVRDALRALASA